MAWGYEVAIEGMVNNKAVQRKILALLSLVHISEDSYKGINSQLPADMTNVVKYTLCDPISIV